MSYRMSPILTSTGLRVTDRSSSYGNSETVTTMRRDGRKQRTGLLLVAINCFEAAVPRVVRNVFGKPLYVTFSNESMLKHPH